MNTKILIEYKKFLREEYQSEHTRRNYYKYTELFLRWLWQSKRKNYAQLISEDTRDYKAYCLEHYKQNGNVGRLNGINNFVHKFLNKEELRVTVPKSVQVNKDILTEKELQRYIQATKTPFEYLIAVYQIDGLLRPGEFPKLKISQHNLNKQILYIDETKTGNNRVILTPRMIKAFKQYMIHRIKPTDPKDNDYLIIIDKGSHYRKRIQKDSSDFIYRYTKKIAARAGFKRSIYPYLIKPSTITNGFNNKVNPKILQRQARHKKIETTLRYDHVSDEMVKEFFNQQQEKNINSIENMSTDEKAKIWLDKLLHNEIDLKTYKSGLDVLLPNKRNEHDFSYF